MSKPTQGTMNAGAVQLAALIGGHSQTRRNVAHACQCTDQAVRGWEAGLYAPVYRFRVALETAYGIPAGSWDAAADVTGQVAA